MKWKYAVCFTILVFKFASLIAQGKDIEGHLSISATGKTVKESIDSLNDLADTLCLHKSERGMKLAMLALGLSKREKYHIGIGDASHSLGLTKFRRENDSAIYYFMQARNEYLLVYPGFEKTVHTLNNISRTYFELLQYDSAILYARQAISFIEGKKEPVHIKSKWLMYTYGAMANAFSGLSRYDTANLFYLKAINLAEALQNKKMLEVYFKGLSGIQSKLGDHLKAAVYVRKAIDFIEDDDRALTIALANLGSIYSRLHDQVNADLMADSSLRVGRRSNVTNSIGRNYITLGNSQLQQKNYKQALQLYKTGLENAMHFKNSKSTISSLHLQLGNIYDLLDSIVPAKEHYAKALQIGDGNYEIASNINLSLSKLYIKEGDYVNAYKHLKAYNLFHDSVYTNEKIKIITELNTRYESEKKDQQLQLMTKERQLQEALLIEQKRQIEKDNAEKREQQLAILNFQLEADKKGQLLKIKELDLENSHIKQEDQKMLLVNASNRLKIEEQQKQINISTIKNQRSWLIILFSGIIVFSIISFLLFNRFKLKKKLHSQAELLLQRQQISRDLHDEIGATLSGIAMYSHLAREQLKKSQPDAIENSLGIIQNHAGEMVNKLNDIIWLVNPGQDSLKKLLHRLEDYAVQMAAVKNIRVKSNFNGQQAENILPPETRRNIYLLFKEAINNAVKYSNATMLEFSFNDRKDNLEIILKDNGIGFTDDSIIKGNGLVNMEQRASTINAAFHVTVSPGNGTAVSLIIPGFD